MQFKQMVLNTNERTTTDGEYIFSVSELNQTVGRLLERHFGQILIHGEISNLKTPASGHVYFTLKDNKAAIRCALFRSRSHKLSFRPKDGDQVVVTAKISVYAERGDYQLIVDSISPEGEGQLQQMFEQLKKELSAQGLFAPEHKVKPKALPHRIGIITSATGAALQDVLHVLQKRCPMVPIKLYPAPVQGTKAPAQLCQALRLAQTENVCDVILLVRGGGSLEDLWAFNDIQLAHQIYQCPIPIITGVGHEIDFTIADLVADVRAPTPSAAAETAVPNSEQLRQKVSIAFTRLRQQLQMRLNHLAQKTDYLHYRMPDPSKLIATKSERVNQNLRVLDKLIHNHLQAKQNRYFVTAQKLISYHPKTRCQQGSHRLALASHKLQQCIQKHFDRHQDRLNNLAHKLDIMSPLATLQRGYAIVINANGQVVRTPDGVKDGDLIEAKLSSGSIYCRVEQKD